MNSGFKRPRVRCINGLDPGGTTSPNCRPIVTDARPVFDGPIAVRPNTPMDLYRSARERLGVFVAQGLLTELPTDWQIMAGTIASLPVIFGETARGRTNSRRTLLGQIPVRVPLQILYNPLQAFSINGLLCSERTVLKHLLCVYHEDAMLTYDIQLLQTFPGGLERLETEARRIVTGASFGARTLREIVSDRDYHSRLAGVSAAARRFEYPADTIDPRFCSLLGFVRFCCSLPAMPPPGFYTFDWEARNRVIRDEPEARPSWQRTPSPVDAHQPRAQSAAM